MRPIPFLLAACLAVLAITPAQAGISAVFGGLRVAGLTADAAATAVCPAPAIGAVSLADILARLPAEPL
jgi:hypothetical protein